MPGTNPFSMRFMFLPVPCVLAIAVTAGAQQAPTWQPVPLSNLPPAREIHAMAYDLARSRLVLFGGMPGPLNDTWEFDGVAWSASTPAVVPPARCCHSMAYVPGGRVVMFGGTPSSDPLAMNDTWEWDGITWTQLAPAQSPSPRLAHAMTTDWLSGRVVLFGGRDWQSVHQGDTWSWDGTNWALLAGNGPPPRCCHSIAQDVARGRIVLFGGWNGVDLGDTWEFDGVVWQAMSVLGSAPSARWGHRLGYDFVNSRLVMHGGTVGGSETWQWDGSSWTFLAGATPIYNHEIAYDWNGSRLLRVGGVSGQPIAETWTLSTPSPASASPFGVSCPGSAGTSALAPEPGSLPWIGQTFRFDVQPAPGFTLIAFGFSTTASGSIALPFSLATYGAPGCAVLVSPDAVFGTAQSPRAAVAVSLPMTPALVGLQFYTQALTLDPAANALGVTTSNGLAATVGW